MSQANHAHKLSALDEIDATLQPIGPQPCLRAEVDRLVKSNNVRALVALFDAYVASAMAFQSILNRPIARDVEILEKESAHAWSKAFYVADRLKTLRPYKYDLEQYAAALFNCTIAMGNNLEEAVAVVNEINSWPQIERPARLPS
jgi:hypothetical protein